jgi:hypothetical protein
MFPDPNEVKCRFKTLESTVLSHIDILKLFPYRFTVIMSSTLQNALSLADGYRTEGRNII